MKWNFSNLVEPNQNYRVNLPLPTCPNFTPTAKSVKPKNAFLRPLTVE